MDEWCCQQMPASHLLDCEPLYRQHAMALCECVGHSRSQVRFRVLLPVAVACWAAAATLAPQFCADNTVAWLGLTGSPCTAAAMALQVQHSVHSRLSRGQLLAPLSAVKAG